DDLMAEEALDPWRAAARDHAAWRERDLEPPDDLVRRRVDSRHRARAVVVDIEVLAVGGGAARLGTGGDRGDDGRRAEHQRGEECDHVRPPWPIYYEYVLKCYEIVL